MSNRIKGETPTYVNITSLSTSSQKEPTQLQPYPQFRPSTKSPTFVKSTALTTSSPKPPIQQSSTPVKPEMTKDEIVAQFKLDGYVMKLDMMTAPLGSHIKYFKREGASLADRFRCGGFLKKVIPEKNYLILTNNGRDWYVTINENNFFVKDKLGPTGKKLTKTQPKQKKEPAKKKLTQKQLREKENIIMDQMDEIDKLKQEKEQLLKLMKMVKM